MRMSAVELVKKQDGVKCQQPFPACVGGAGYKQRSHFEDNQPVEDSLKALAFWCKVTASHPEEDSSSRSTAHVMKSDSGQSSDI